MLAAHDVEPDAEVAEVVVLVGDELVGARLLPRVVGGELVETLKELLPAIDPPRPPRRAPA